MAAAAAEHLVQAIKSLVVVTTVIIPNKSSNSSDALYPCAIVALPFPLTNVNH